MIIGFAIDKLCPGKIGGAEQYVRNTVSIMGNMEGIELVLFLNEAAMASFEKEESESIHRVCVPYHIQRIKEFYEYYIAKYGVQVLFCPLFYLPCESFSIPVVTSILDIQHEYYPEYFAPDLLQYRRDETRKAIENSNVIITISEFSKMTMIEKLNVDKNKIFVTHLNADSSFDRAIEEERNKEIKERLPEHYIFYPANGWAHKNHRKLIDAYRVLKEKYGTKNKLVLTGNAFNDENKLQAYICERGLKEEVLALGYIEQAEMPYVFANAEMLVFPSLFEGFGIPLVEAMRVGTPIVCSDCGSIPEVVGNAAITFDANDENDMADKIHLLECDVKLREELRQRGYKRATAFSWDKCAVQTLEILKKQAIEDGKVMECSYQPKVTILIPVFSNNADLWELVKSVEKQTYPYKKIILFGERRHVLDEVREKGRVYSVNIEVLEQRKLREFLEQSISDNAEDIYGVLQAGQVLTDAGDLERIVVESIKNREDVLWIKPKKEGFWGLFLKNRIESEPYQKFLYFDQTVQSILFVRNAQRSYLEDISYWFNGYYQQILCGKLLRSHRTFQFVFMDSIVDKNSVSDMRGIGYLKLLWLLWKMDAYISHALINTNDFGQKQLKSRIVRHDTEIKRYYEQIERRGIEFDGILPDGWISRKCELEVEIPDKEGSLIIAGENSDMIEGVVMTVWIDNRKVICDNINIGKFQLEVKIPADINPGRYTLRIEADKTFSYYERTKQDILALSVRIRRMSIHDNIIWER